MTAAEQLAALPDPVQAKLWELVRTAAGMNEAEKATALEGLVTTSERFLLSGWLAEYGVCIQAFNALGQLLHAMHKEATTPTPREAA